MKTIEERAEKWVPNFGEKNRAALKAMLRELAADLNAEKEKEVAELREANQRIANESIANQLALQAVCDRKHDALVNARGWILANAKTPIHALMEYTNLIISEKFDSALLNEVKRVLGAVSSDAGRWFMSGETCDLVDQLLTRLGGSHE